MKTNPPPFDEEEKTVNFFSEETDFILSDPNRIIRWVEQVIEKQECQLHSVTYVFCSDDYLLDLNINYLDHHTLTDIITFPYDQPPIITGDIFISIDRVKENAKTYEVPFEEELQRVMIHGILHLCGFHDKTPDEKSLMTEKENQALSLLASIAPS